jgi:hypothetical protein
MTRALLFGIAVVAAPHVMAQSPSAIGRILFVGDSFTYAPDREHPNMCGQA